MYRNINNKLGNRECKKKTEYSKNNIHVLITTTIETKEGKGVGNIVYWGEEVIFHKTI